MQGAILYTIPDNCVEEMKGRMQKEENVKTALKPEMGEGEEEKKEVKAGLAQPPLKAVIDLTEGFSAILTFSSLSIRPFIPPHNYPG
jgi:hypothetical protein